MEDLPDPLIEDILKRLVSTQDRNTASLVSKRLYTLESHQRHSLKLGRGLHPATTALSSLCNRFPNLRKLEVDYSGWMFKFGPQLDDRGMHVLSTCCPSLTDLTLSFCTFLTDTGLGYLSNFRDLSSLVLNFAPAVGSNGLLSVAFGCKALRRLHVSRCTRVNSTEWLEHLGRIEDLSIKNCRAVGEGDLVKLGTGWSRLEFLEFEMDVNYRDSKEYHARSALSGRMEWPFPCERLKELRLTNCFSTMSGAFSLLLGQCEVLEKVSFDMCVGLRDRDLVLLARNSGNLRSVSLRLPSNHGVHSLVYNPPRLTDEGLRALAGGCLLIEEVSISFPLGDFPSMCCFTQEGILGLIRSCPIRVLVLDHAHFFDDRGMEALRHACFLENLELEQCQEVTDDGLRCVEGYLRLRKLSLRRCLGLTDDGLKPLVGLKKLEFLEVRDCPRISEGGVKGTAGSVLYGQDLSWLF